MGVASAQSPMLPTVQPPSIQTLTPTLTAPPSLTLAAEAKQPVSMSPSDTCRLLTQRLGLVRKAKTKLAAADAKNTTDFSSHIDLPVETHVMLAPIVPAIGPELVANEPTLGEPPAPAITAIAPAQFAELPEVPLDARRIPASSVTTAVHQPPVVTTVATDGSQVVTATMNPIRGKANSEPQEDSLLDLTLPGGEGAPSTPSTIQIHESFAPKSSTNSFHLSDDEDGQLAVGSETIEAQPITEPLNAVVPAITRAEPIANAPAVKPSVGIARSSSQRPISLRIGSSALVVQPKEQQPTPVQQVPVQRSEPAAPPIMSGPLVRVAKPALPVESQQTSQNASGKTEPSATRPIVKAPATPELTPATNEVVSQTESTPATTAATSVDPNSPQHATAALNETIKKNFPNSRVSIKADDEGLIVEGVAVSESEAKKILALVRTTALCPVSDRVITKR